MTNEKRREKIEARERKKLKAANELKIVSAFCLYVAEKKDKYLPKCGNDLNAVRACLTHRS